MSNMLRSPSVGPIVGHTTTASARVWMRGADDVAGRTVGIAALYDSTGTYVAGSAQYIRLNREFDRTGIVDFTGLAPGAAYTARVGSLTMDSTDEMEQVDDGDLYAKLPTPGAWLGDLAALAAEESTATFSTFPATDGGDLSFIFGSCRYPGLVWAAKKADRIFGAVSKNFSAPAAVPPRFLLMVGDQIYADKMNKALPIGRADTPSEFHDRYIAAFTSPNMRGLLRSVPTYMILDDHEIEDNWIQSRIEKQEKRALFQAAISAYMSYQWLHSPRNYDARGPVATGNGRQVYYSFECSGYPFFVMDSRTQRIRGEVDEDFVLDDNHLLGYPAKPSAGDLLGQIDVLCNWLVAQQQRIGNRPKFIVSPSVFVPNDVETVKSDKKKCDSDSWPAFPTTRRQLLQAIVANDVQNVVFLCGDVHCSNVAEIFFTDTTSGTRLPLRAFSITSSAFYWPWPFSDGDPLGFVHDSTAEGDSFAVTGDIAMNYRAKNFEQEDNYTQVTISGNTITAQNYDCAGNPLGKTEFLMG